MPLASLLVAEMVTRILPCLLFSSRRADFFKRRVRVFALPALTE